MMKQGRITHISLHTGLTLVEETLREKRCYWPKARLVLYRVAHVKECWNFATKESVKIGILNAIKGIGADIMVGCWVSEMKLLS
jgi:hypothetical protein